VLAELVLQRLVQEVGRRVVRHRRETDGPRHDRSYTRAKSEPLTPERQHLVVLESRRPEELGACARFLVLDIARIGHLTATLRIEGRGFELRLERPIAEILVGDECREHVCPLVPDELASRRGTGDPHVYVERRRAARALPLLLHESREFLLVHLEPTFCGELLRQLERKAVRVV